LPNRETRAQQHAGLVAVAVAIVRALLSVLHAEVGGSEAGARTSSTDSSTEFAPGGLTLARMVAFEPGHVQMHRSADT
jgi:hypothetical protein